MIYCVLLLLVNTVAYIISINDIVLASCLVVFDGVLFLYCVLNVIFRSKRHCSFNQDIKNVLYVID